VAAIGAERRWRMGETVGSYDDPNLRGQGESTASQTAWAIMGLLAVGDTRSECVARGMAYLLRTQNKDGSWDEAFFTGTGFPRVFYLKYHLYREYFPLIALTTYSKVMRRRVRASSQFPFSVLRRFQRDLVFWVLLRTEN